MSDPDLPAPTPEPPEPTPEAKPEPALEAKKPPTTASVVRPMFYGCLSIVLAVPFGIAYLLISAWLGLPLGAACAAAIVLGMFLLRRENKKPIIGALAAGAAIAFAIHGTCLIIIAKSS